MFFQNIFCNFKEIKNIPWCVVFCPNLRAKLHPADWFKAAISSTEENIALHLKGISFDAVKHEQTFQVK